MDDEGNYPGIASQSKRYALQSRSPRISISERFHLCSDAGNPWSRLHKETNRKNRRYEMEGFF